MGTKRPNSLVYIYKSKEINLYLYFGNVVISIYFKLEPSLCPKNITRNAQSQMFKEKPQIKRNRKNDYLIHTRSANA